MSIRTIGLSTAIFALAFTMQSAGAKPSPKPKVSPTPKSSMAPNSSMAPKSKKAMNVKAVAPSRPGPQ